MGLDNLERPAWVAKGDFPLRHVHFETGIDEIAVYRAVGDGHRGE